MKKTETKQVLLRLPVPLLRKLEAAAKAQQRSRNAEVCRRLMDSVKKSGVEA